MRLLRLPLCCAMLLVSPAALATEARAAADARVDADARAAAHARAVADARAVDDARAARVARAAEDARGGEDALAREMRAADRLQRWKLAPALGSDFPLGVGAQLRVESPEGIRVSGGFGMVPSGYVDALLGVASAFAGADPRVEALAKASIDGWMGTFSAGWRPWPLRGWYFTGGYSALKLDGSLNAQDAAIVLYGALGALAPNRDYRASASVHMLRIEAGYTQPLFEVLELSVGFGFAASLHTTADIEWGFGNADSGSRAANEVQDTLQQYLHLPTLSVALGYELVGKPVVDTSVHSAPTHERHTRRSR